MTKELKRQLVFDISVLAGLVCTAIGSYQQWDVAGALIGTGLYLGVSGLWGSKPG